MVKSKVQKLANESFLKSLPYFIVSSFKVKIKIMFVFEMCLSNSSKNWPDQNIL